MLCIKTVFASEYIYYYKGLVADINYPELSAEIDSALHKEMKQLIKLTAKRPDAHLVVGGSINIRKNKVDRLLGKDEGNQFLSKQENVYKITITTVVRNGSDNAYVSTIEKTFGNNSKESALRQLALEIIAVKPLGVGKHFPVPKTEMPGESKDVTVVTRKPSFFDHGFYSPSISAGLLYLHPFMDYSETIEYGIGTTLLISVFNRHVFDLRFNIEVSGVYLSEQKLASEDLTLLRNSVYISQSLYRNPKYNLSVGAGGGYHFHVGEGVYKQPHFLCKIDNGFIINRNFAVVFSSGAYSYLTEDSVLYYIEPSLCLEYKF